jgi:hypothetical protein
LQAAHCSSAALGQNNWDINLGLTKAQCDADANRFWLESQCQRSTDNVFVESGRTAMDCELRRQSVTSCIEGCSDPSYTTKTACIVSVTARLRGSEKCLLLWL